MDPEQEKLLEEATMVVREQARFMRRAIDDDNLRDALKHASSIICELRTSLLSPKNYYELYMSVFHELQYLSSFFGDRSRHGRKMNELYESVQHAGNILPRLYLLVTVGSTYIKSQEAPAKDILKDMTELAKGIQHPMRGLFLRYYLVQMCKDKLPDVGSPYEISGGGTMVDAFDFLYHNFIESTRLWVRLQHQGGVRDRTRREAERRDLRVLVGATLVRLAQLEGMNTVFYHDIALPKLLRQIVACKDVIAQQYLLDCLIQVFSDECHLITLDALLSACNKTLPGVDVKPVLVNLMTRLANFVRGNPEAVASSEQVFELFRIHITELMEGPVIEAEPPGGASAPAGSAAIDSKPEKEAGMRLPSLLELLVAFLNFTLTLYPDRVDYVDVILRTAAALLARVAAGESPARGRQTGGNLGEDFGPDAAARPARLWGKLEAGNGVESVVELLAAPLRTFNLSILGMSHYTALMQFLDFDTKKKVAVSMLEAVLAARTRFSSVTDVSRFLSFISPLIIDQPGGVSPCASFPSSFPAASSGAAAADAASAFEEEQVKVGQLVHLVGGNLEETFLMLQTAAKAFKNGGKKRIAYTYPALTFAFLELIQRLAFPQEAEPGTARATPDSVATPAVPTAAMKNLSLSSPREAGDRVNSPGKADGRGERENAKDPTSPPFAADEGGGHALANSNAPAVHTLVQDKPNVTHKKVFQVVHRLITELAEADPQTAARLFLHGGMMADKICERLRKGCPTCGPALSSFSSSSSSPSSSSSSPSSCSFSGSSSGPGSSDVSSCGCSGRMEAITDEFLTQSLLCYEEHLSDHKSQYCLLVLLVGTLTSQIKFLPAGSYENLSAKITQHAAKLLKRPDQCKAVLLCSHLWWNNRKYRDAVRVLECLQKAIKVADVAIQSAANHLALFPEILEHYLYYFEQDNKEITTYFIQNLVALCAEHLQYAEGAPATSESALKSFRNSVLYIRRKAAEDSTSKFAELQLPALQIEEA
eukprot:GHVT01029742.1.p1 GENE.GHVT01029742.1~~GHVT01029742.1.p1  ORF type:complete len:994 (-),score=265.02 GHVT01029742.1:584-3565(-)